MAILAIQRVPEISASTLLKEASGESSQIVATRVAAARQFGARRNQGVSRTIADLAGDDRVGRAALAEALAYRAMPLLA